MKRFRQFKTFHFFSIFVIFIMIFIGCSQNQESVNIKNKEKIQIETILEELEALKASNTEFIKTNKKLKNQITDLENTSDKNETNLQEKVFQLNNTIDSLKEQLKNNTSSKDLNITAADKAELKQKMNEESIAIATTPPQPSSNLNIVDQQKMLTAKNLFDTNIPDKEKNNADLEDNDDTNKNELAIIEEPPKEDYFDPALSEPEFPFILKQQVNARKEYIEAYRFYTLKDYNEAIKKFNSFLQKYPDEYYSDNSQYWIAMSYLKLNKLKEAQDSFHKLLKNFEHGESSLGFKTPDAILGLGQIKLKQKKNDHAIYYFNKIIEKYPNSSAARTSLNLLNNIDNQ